MQHKIGWCDEIINSAWGCKNKCKYCYARNIAKRFGYSLGKSRGYFFEDLMKMKNFDLIWFPDWIKIFNEKVKCKKPKRFFIGDMSEIAYWGADNISNLIFEIQDNNLYRIEHKLELHTFQFLTKNPIIYDQFNFPDNCWLGWTITSNSAFLKYCNSYGPEFGLSGKNDDNIFFASIEPIHGPISEKIIDCFNWIIIGAETGNHKGKIVPKFPWIDNIYQACGEYNIPIYMKDNLGQVFPDLVLPQEFPVIKKP